ncbi:MAG: Rrf2 family transcriptional regulator [bacterium]
MGTANALKISEAASLALHSMTYLAASGADKPVSARDLAETFDVSAAHLSKVLNRLASARLLKSTRGAKGGFVLARKSGDVTLGEIYELFDGPLAPSDCLFETPVCKGKKCIFGALLGAVNKSVAEYLFTTKLSDLTEVYRRAGAGS